MKGTKEYGKRVTTLSRPKPHKSELEGYKAKASPKDWSKKKPVDLDTWASKKAPKKKTAAKPVKAKAAKTTTTRKKKAAR